jgi:hypothetical protein
MKESFDRTEQGAVASQIDVSLAIGYTVLRLVSFLPEYQPNKKIDKKIR